MRKILKKALSIWERARKFNINRWRYLFLNLSQKEKTTITGLLIFAAAVSFFLAGYEYWVLREPFPARGGTYIEGIIGEPRYLNPVLGTNNEVDRDLITLLFAGLTKHDPDGNIIGDLAEEITIKEKGRVYEFTLREDLTWPDGKPITTEDVIFTIDLIQSPEYQSPVRSNWQGVRAEVLDERKIRLTLNLPYKPFLENTTIGILPKHFWQNIKPQNFALAELNIKPVGAGPYRIKKIVKDPLGSIKLLELVRNETYYQEVFIDRILVRFYQTEDDLINAYRQGDINGLSLFSPRAKKEIAGRNPNFNNVRMPRYFAIFFNENKNNLFKNTSIRQALAQATPKEKIVSEILLGEANVQEGPLPQWWLKSDQFSTYEFSEEQAKDTLINDGWQDTDDDGIREKSRQGSEPQILELTLTTTDWPELTQTVSILKEHWERVGFSVNLDIIPVSSIQQQVIRPRDYEVLLFGEVLGIEIDPFSFWHSSQIKDPGLNLSFYKNKRADELLESARQTLDEEQRQAKYEEFQQIITRDLAAIFLYSPHYIYAQDKKIKGFNTTLIGTPSQRFENVNQWYIKTKRTREQ